MFKHIVEKLLTLLDIVLDCIEDTLLLLKLLVELVLPLVIEIELSDRVFLEFVEFAQSVYLVLISNWLLRIVELRLVKLRLFFFLVDLLFC